MKNMFTLISILPHNLLQTNPCIRHNFSTQVFRKRTAQLYYVGPELRYISWPPKAFWRLVSKRCDECKGSFARGCEAKQWSHWTCSSLGTIFQPMRINSVTDVKCFCNNKNVLRAQSMVRHFVRHPVYFNNFILSLFSFPHRLSRTSCDARAEYPTVDRSRHERRSKLPSWLSPGCHRGCKGGKHVPSSQLLQGKMLLAWNRYEILNVLILLHSFSYFVHSFHWHVRNSTIPCLSQKLLPFLSVTYFFLPPFMNYSSILYHLIWPSISWSTSHLFVTKFIYNTLLGILFSSILCTCPNQRNLFNLIVSAMVCSYLLPPFTNYSSILYHLILPSISWSTSQSCCYQIHI